jgi:galactokinase
VPIDSPDPYPGAPWAAYPRGVLLEAARAGAPRFGVQAAIVDDLPVGAGVSSSAALEVATLEAYLALARIEPWDALERARLCQRAECDFVGVPCGLLDQFSAVFGRADHLLFLDCQTLEHAVAPLPETLRVVVADSGTRHALVDGRYAELRRSCEQAARALEELLETPVPDLRAVALERFLELASRIPPAPRRRAEHVLRENARVLAGRAAGERGDLEELGRLMLASHASSRDLLGNSSPELDVLVEEASRLPGFLGGKLTGGGFGGATVNLVAPASAAAFSPALAARYHARTGRDARLLESGIGDGARRFVL